MKTEDIPRSLEAAYTFYEHFFAYSISDGFRNLNMRICIPNQQVQPPPLPADTLRPASQPVSPASKERKNYCNETGSNVSKQIPLQTLILGKEIRALSPVEGDNLVGQQEESAWAADKRRTPAAEHYTSAEDAGKAPELPGDAGWGHEVRSHRPAEKQRQNSCRIWSSAAMVHAGGDLSSSELSEATAVHREPSPRSTLLCLPGVMTTYTGTKYGEEK